MILWTCVNLKHNRLKLSPITYPLSPKKSFTLIELLISAAILTAIVTLTVGSFSQTVSFGSSSTDQRIARQTARTFSDWITRQVRKVSSTQIQLLSGTFCVVEDTKNPNTCTKPDPALGTTYFQYTDYFGNGFIMLQSYAGGDYQIVDPASAKGVTGIIVPATGADGKVAKWMYIGSCSSNVVVKSRDAQADPNQNVLDPANPCTDWTDAGSVIPAEVKMTGLKFFGVPPRALKYDATGNPLSYNYPIQPYLTWSFKIAPLSDLGSVTSFETTITSRDYNFAYPN